MAATTIDWKWVGIGLVILLFAVLKPITYFLGGLMPGCISPGITIRERWQWNRA